MYSIRRINMLGALLLLVLAFLQYRLWVEPGGIKSVLKLKRKLAAQVIQNDTLKKENDALETEVKQLRQNDDAIEARARTELGMIKQGETFYRIVEKSPSDTKEKT